MAAYQLPPQISLYSDSICINIARPHLSLVTWGRTWDCVKVVNTICICTGVVEVEYWSREKPEMRNEEMRNDGNGKQEMKKWA